MLSEFCKENEYDFPPNVAENSGVIADFLCEKTENSDRPESMLTAIMAALGHFYQVSGLNPLPIWLHNLKHALIKTCSTKAKGRTPIMPITELNALFDSWADNELLPMKKLPQKCVLLLALAAMCRPSDLTKFRRNDVKFNSDGSLTIVYFGIKNDLNRKGFEIRIQPAGNKRLDPVTCSQAYIDKTRSITCAEGPAFLSLIPPHEGLSAAGIFDILRDTIREAGLGVKKFTPRCFRPTGAAASIRAGNDPEVTRQLGRWKTREVFYDSYVYPLAHATFTGQLLPATT